MAEQGKRPKMVNEESIEQIEKETLDLIIKSLPEIEKNLAGWDNLKNRPEALKSKFEKYRLIHESLSTWARNVLTSPGGDFESRVDRTLKPAPLRSESRAAQSQSSWRNGSSSQKKVGQQVQSISRSTTKSSHLGIRRLGGRFFLAG